MTQKDLNNWIMYHEIHKLNRFGFSNAKIARYLMVDPRTVSKYLKMSEEEYEEHLLRFCQRKKILSPFEDFVKDKLSLFQDTSSAQIHDWLKEEFKDVLPHVSPRTVYNFVMYIRQKYNIPYVRTHREYFPVEECPYGEQAQVDFGEYNMRLSNGKRKKVRFFAMVLSRSRMKFTYFTNEPYTAKTVIEAHEKSFEFFDGIPKTVVYDQDRTMVIDENMGDIILTSTFKNYTRSRGFKLHFCRKADPESKGKVENVIQYIKKNFLYNRLYSDLENLNNEAVAWLARTANSLVHNYTKKTPESEYQIERSFLNPYTPLKIKSEEMKIHHVRKTNIIAYKSNFYSVPMGTYQGQGTQVVIREDQGYINIYNLDDELICTHQLSALTGQTITNTDHKRDKSKSLNKMMDQTAKYFTDQSLISAYLNQIKSKYPRYTRDHLYSILKTLKRNNQKAADRSLDFCLKHELISGYDFEQVYSVLLDEIERSKIIEKPEIKLLDESNLEKAEQTPQTSNIEDYEDIINL